MSEFFSQTFLGYRKFVIMMLVIIIAVVFRIDGLIDGGQMVELVRDTVLAFFGGNTAEHITTAAKAYLTKSTQPVPENPDAKGAPNA